MNKLQYLSNSPEGREEAGNMDIAVTIAEVEQNKGLVLDLG